MTALVFVTYGVISTDTRHSSELNRGKRKAPCHKWSVASLVGAERAPRGASQYGSQSIPR